MFWPIFARGLWPETSKASFSRTNQRENKRRRQTKRVKIFLTFTYPHKTQPGQKIAGNFIDDIYSPDVWDPGLDAGLNTPRFGGDIAFPIGKIGRGLPSLFYATSSQIIKHLDKTSFQSCNLFRTMKTYATNAKSSLIQNFSRVLPYGLKCVS